MRSYDDYQRDTEMFEGQKAQEIIGMVKSKDERAQEICERLHDAFNIAQEEFKQLDIQYQPQFQKLFQGTSLENVPYGQIGLDLSNAEKHGVVFAVKRKANPFEVLLDSLRDAVENGPPDYGDRIIFETFDEKKPDVAGAWSGQRQRETETA